MAKSFLRKTNRKAAMGIAQESVTRGLGTVGAAYAHQNLMARLTFLKPEYRGAALLGVGMLGEMFLDG